MVLKDRKTGDVYKLNIVNVVVECDVIYVSILYNLYRICKAGQFAGIYSPLPPWKVYIIYIILKVQRRDRCAGWWIDPNRNMNEKEGLDIAGTEH